jgi:hypothetical protein
MKKLLFIGKNSNLFTKVGQSLAEHFDVHAISHKEIKENNFSYDIILVASYSIRIKSNLKLFEKINSCLIFKKIVYISSAVVGLGDEYDFYNYVKIKRELEKLFFIEFKEKSIAIRPYQVEGDTKSEYPLITKPIDFVRKIQIVADLKKTTKVVVFTPSRGSCSATPNSFYIKLFVRKHFLMCRFFDFFYKKNGFKNYGYTYGLMLMEPS